MQNPAKSLAILLLVIVAVALAACNNSSDDGRITALEEGLSRAEAQERKSREAAADEREEIAERLSALEQALERAEAERNTNEEMNAETRSLVMSLLTGMPGGSGVGGMRPTDEQMLQEVGMERERLLQKVPRFVMEGASPDQKTVIEAGTDCLASRDQGMPEQLQELTLENYRLNAERTENDVELVMMTFMTCSTARMEPGEIGTPSAERADATAMLVACYAEHEDIAGDQPSVEMVEQTLSIFDDDGVATSIARLICQGLSQEAMRQ